MDRAWQVEAVINDIAAEGGRRRTDGANQTKFTMVETRMMIVVVSR